MSEELVTIATSYNIVEAEFLRNHLESEGFEVYLADENIVGAYNLLANAVGGIKIRVPTREVDEASAFLHDLQNAEILGEDGEPIDEGHGECGKCGSRNLSLVTEDVGIKGILMFLGFGAAKPVESLICNICGTEKASA